MNFPLRGSSLLTGDCAVFVEEVVEGRLSEERQWLINLGLLSKTNFLSYLYLLFISLFLEVSNPKKILIACFLAWLHYTYSSLLQLNILLYWLTNWDCTSSAVAYSPRVSVLLDSRISLFLEKYADTLPQRGGVSIFYLEHNDWSAWS